MYLAKFSARRGLAAGIGRGSADGDPHGTAVAVSSYLIPVAALLPGTTVMDARANGDLVQVEKVFRYCYSCHTVQPGETNLQGPNLHAIVGRRILSQEGAGYSPALRAPPNNRSAGARRSWIAIWYGDCEDYQLVKRKCLVEAGFPRRALGMAVVIAEEGAWHAVMVGRTNRGDFILDNKRDVILPWHKTGYTYIKREGARACPGPRSAAVHRRP